MRWSGIEGIYGKTLRATTVFEEAEGDKRYQDLHTRVMEHVSRIYCVGGSMAKLKETG